jgi:hypothetical protein
VTSPHRFTCPLFFAALVGAALAPLSACAATIAQQAYLVGTVLGGDAGSNVVLSPDGTMLAIIIRRQSLQVWRAPSLSEIDRLPNW